MIRPGDRVAVVGGGLLGLTLAWRLAGRGIGVTIYEAEPELGGLAAGWSIPASPEPVEWDRYYHVVLESDAEWRAILAELDLDAEIRWTTTRTGYFGAGRLVGASTPRELLSLPGLGLISKLRIGLTLARGMTVRNGDALEDRTAAEWLTRWSGRRAFAEFWRPLLETKLGGAWPQTNASFIWATIQRLTAARRAGIGDERFGAWPGGYGRAVATLADRLRAAGVVTHGGARVAAVDSPDGAAAPTVTAAGRTETFDHVVVTTTPRVAAAMITTLDPVTAAQWRQVPYQGIVCVSLVLDRPQSPYYLTYLVDELPFTAIVEMTTLIPPAWVGGRSLVYLPRYAGPGDAWFERSDREVVDGFLAGLERVHPGVGAAVVAARVARTTEVFPIPVCGYSRMAPSMDTGVRGVSLVSSAQIVNGTLNVNETVRRAEAAAAALTGGDPATSLGSAAGSRP